MLNKNVLFGIVLIASAGVAQADTVGGSIDVSVWVPAYSGDAASSLSTIDLEDNLGLGTEAVFAASASLEHPVPALPNIKLKYVDLSQADTGSVNSNFDGVNFTGAVKTDLDLSHVDLVLYYEVLDNLVSLDVGLDVKAFNGAMDIRQINNTAKFSNTNIDEFVPLLYTAASVDLPGSGWSLGGEISGVTYAGNTLYDAGVKVRKDIKVFYLELGYRQLGVNLDDLSGIDVDTQIGGPFLTTGIDL